MKSKANIINENIALVEIGGSHDECLYSQIHALKSIGKKVFLICNAEIRARNTHFEDLVDAFYEVDFTKSKVENFKITKGVLSYIKRNNISKVILNTAQGANIRNLCLLAYWTSVEFVGLIHTTRKLDGSFTQRLINMKVKKLLLLSTFLLSKVQVKKGITVDYFYPIRFNTNNFIKRDHSKTQISIIGGVENRRKDLDGFLQMIGGIDTNVHFTFLGKSDLSNQEVFDFKDKIRELGLEHQITLFDHFISQEEFEKQLEVTDLILPLIHPETRSAEQYFNNQISGAVNIAFGNKIPLLIHEGYKFIDEMNEASIYYTKENFASLFPINKDRIKGVVEGMTKKKEYAADYQEKRYLDFLFTQ